MVEITVILVVALQLLIDCFYIIKALRLPSSALTRYRLLYPMRHGTLNCQDYDSLHEVLGDLETIWTEAIREELEIEKKELRVG